MTDNQAQNPFHKAFQSVKQWFSTLADRFSTPKRLPELAELEARFHKDANSDPEKVKDRQFSNTIRSGRG